MSDQIRVVLVADDTDGLERDADALSQRPGVVVTATASPGPPWDDVADADCLVIDDPHLEVPAEVPVVVFADGPPPTASRESVDGFVRRDGDADWGGNPDADGNTAVYDHLADQVRFVADAVPTRTPGGAGRNETPERTSLESPSTDLAEKIHRLHEGTADIVASRSMDELYEGTVAVAEEVLAFDVSYLLIREGDRFVPRASSSAPTETGLESVPLDYGLTGHTYETGETYLVADVDADPYADPAHGDYGSGISVPIGDWGVFQATAKERGAFDADDLELAELLLSYANETHQRIAMEDRLRDRQTTIERLHESTADIVGCRSESELTEKTIAAAENVLEFEACVVLLAADGDGDDPEGPLGEYVIEAASGADLTPPVGSRHDATSGVLGETVRTGESQLVDDVADHDAAAPHDETYRSGLSVPIGEHGVFQAISQRPGTYDEVDRRLAELLVAHVTESLSRIRVEAALREREDELVEERDRLAALFENVPDAVAEFSVEDGELVVRDVNGRFEDTFGYDVAHLRGEPIDEYIVPQGHEPTATDLNEKLLTGERSRRTVRRRTDDGIGDFLLQVVPIDVGERNVSGYAIYTDVTDQKRRERTLERQNERLDQFASIVSHDLRNPLNVAQGNLELARESCEADALDRVARSHDRMERMIDDLLSLARRGDIVGDTVPVELREAAAEAWANVETGEATLDVVDDVVLVADRERFVELLENLYRNAVEHGSTSSQSMTDDAAEHGSTSSQSMTDDAAEHGSTSSQSMTDDAAEHGSTSPRSQAHEDAHAGAAVAVTVGTWDDGIFVADDGPGIPEAEREQVFESGYTTARDGTGFGLTIVEQIADAHGWSVEVTDDGGARFEFSIPDDEVSSAD